VPGRRGEGEHSDQGPPGLTGAGGDPGIVSGRIPTVFHFVLAAYLFILSHYQTRLARRAGRA
jgi:hypothetical protein